MSVLHRTVPLAVLGLSLGLISGSASALMASGAMNVSLRLYGESCDISSLSDWPTEPDMGTLIDGIGALAVQCSVGVGAFDVQSDSSHRSYAVARDGSPTIVSLVPVFQVGERTRLLASGSPDLASSKGVYLIIFSF